MTEKTEQNSFFIRYVKIIVVLAVIAGSSSGIFGKACAAPPMAIGFWRLTLGLPFFAVPVLMYRRDQLKALTRKEVVMSLVAGAFLFAHFFTWYTGVKMTNIGSAVVLAALHPLVVLFATIFVFKRHVGRRPIMGIILAILGGAMVAGLDGRELAQGNLVGDIFAFLAGLFMGIYFVIGNEQRRTIPGPVYVFLCFLGCWICFTLGTVATGTPVLGYTAWDYLMMVCMTIICQIGAHAAFNLCMGHVSSLYVSTWETGESVFAIILGMIFLHEVPTSWEVLGAVVVMIGLLYYNYFTNLEEQQ